MHWFVLSRTMLCRRCCIVASQGTRCTPPLCHDCGIETLRRQVAIDEGAYLVGGFGTAEAGNLLAIDEHQDGGKSA